MVDCSERLVEPFVYLRSSYFIYSFLFYFERRYTDAARLGSEMHFSLFANATRLSRWGHRLTVLWLASR